MAKSKSAPDEGTITISRIRPSECVEDGRDADVSVRGTATEITVVWEAHNASWAPYGHPADPNYWIEDPSCLDEADIAALADLVRETDFGPAPDAAPSARPPGDTDFDLLTG